MGLASLILGIISLVMSCIPLIGLFFCITAVIGIILGIISLCKKQDKGKSIAGIITSSIAILIIIVYVIVMVLILGGDNGLIEQIRRETESLTNDTEITEIKKCAVGETFNNDKIAITFITADSNFKGYNEYANIKEGYKIIRAEFEFENVGATNQYISSYDFECYADGYDCDSFWSVEDSSFSTTLSSGKKAKGVVYFEVPENSTNITLEYDVDTWKEERVEFIVQ